MRSLHDLRNNFADSPDSMAARYRQHRWEMLRSEFPDIDQMTVIDLGGTASAWRRAPVRPAHVHVVNLEPLDPDPPEWIEVENGDACAPSAAIESRRYDLVYSNSVLEHVGGHMQREAFANTVHTLSERHWVQTPYRYFPVEPHWLFPWFQNLPVAGRVFVSRRWPLVHSPSSEKDAALSAVMGVELLSRSEMTHYFPRSRLLSERVGPLVKSLIAVAT